MKSEAREEDGAHEKCIMQYEQVAQEKHEEVQRITLSIQVVRAFAVVTTLYTLSNMWV